MPHAKFQFLLMKYKNKEIHEKNCKMFEFACKLQRKSPLSFNIKRKRNRRFIVKGTEVIFLERKQQSEN